MFEIGLGIVKSVVDILDSTEISRNAFVQLSSLFEDMANNSRDRRRDPLDCDVHFVIYGPLNKINPDNGLPYFQQFDFDIGLINLADDIYSGKYARRRVAMLKKAIDFCNENNPLPFSNIRYCVGPSESEKVIEHLCQVWREKFKQSLLTFGAGSDSLLTLSARLYQDAETELRLPVLYCPEKGGSLTTFIVHPSIQHGFRCREMTENSQPAAENECVVEIIDDDGIMRTFAYDPHSLPPEENCCYMDRKASIAKGRLEFTNDPQHEKAALRRHLGRLAEQLRFHQDLVEQTFVPVFTGENVAIARRMSANMSVTAAGGSVDVGVARMRTGPGVYFAPNRS